MDRIVDFIVSRMSERSSWLGLTAVVASLGLGVFAHPEFAAAFSTLGLGAVGMLAFFMKDRGSDD